MNFSSIEKIDSQKMYKVYDNWPQIAKESFDFKTELENFENIKHIIFAGMGGSGAIGDMFASILSQKNIHVNVVKGYLLPKTANSDTIVVIISVSGNTIETLSVLKSAQKLKCKIIAFSSGGEIQKFCIKNNIKHKVVSKFHSPRATFTSYLYTILKVLHQTLNIKEEDILESIKKLDELNKKINSSNLTDSNPAINLAKWITDIPIIYYPFGLQAAAVRFKNSLQENCKIHAIAEDVIEACHNGIVSWEKKSNILPILIRGSEDNIKTKERYEILKEFFTINNIEYKELISIEGNILSKLINLIYLLDYTSVYKAIINKTNPSPVKSIDFVKERIS
ncbi:SIS domain-containing protein [Nitrosopumilus sp.]|nr:SIS domain-containing protein [Nitrosopumilus sp.]|tara:strand:- start:30140 stop:31150 length:1011 start_codon:yes stop_codon:yes gene_type:complete